VIIILTRLPHRVIVQSETRTNFEGGAYTTSWETSSTEWANCQMINMAGTKEDYQKNKKQQYTEWRVIMRNSTNITNKKRLLFSGRILKIETVSNPTNRGRMLEITCREEVV
jgi:SPP1 family predicted phage head-tail adaptor